MIVRACHKIDCLYLLWDMDHRRQCSHNHFSYTIFLHILFECKSTLKRLKLCKINKNIIGSTGSMETQCFRVRWPSDVDTVNVTSAWNIQRVYYPDRVTVPVHWLSFLYLPRQSRQSSLVSGRRLFRSVKFSLFLVFRFSSPKSSFEPYRNARHCAPDQTCLQYLLSRTKSLAKILQKWNQLSYLTPTTLSQTHPYHHHHHQHLVYSVVYVDVFFSLYLVLFCYESFFNIFFYILFRGYFFF